MERTPGVAEKGIHRKAEKVTYNSWAAWSIGVIAARAWKWSIRMEILVRCSPARADKCRRGRVSGRGLSSETGTEPCTSFGRGCAALGKKNEAKPKKTIVQ